MATAQKKVTKIIWEAGSGINYNSRREKIDFFDFSFTSSKAKNPRQWIVP